MVPQEKKLIEMGRGLFRGLSFGKGADNVCSRYGGNSSDEVGAIEKTTGGGEVLTPSNKSGGSLFCHGPGREIYPVPMVAKDSVINKRSEGTESISEVKKPGF